MVVDVQVDFCPGGSLAVKGGDSIVPRLNAVIEAFEDKGFPIFFTRDWHPPDHCSFNSRGGPWPPHCVAGTHGADFAPGLKVPAGSETVSKATKSGSDAYSAFQGTGLARKLRDAKAGELFIGGLATDYCVKESAFDALDAGFAVSVMKDCVKGVNVRRGDSALALRAMESRGARLVTSAYAIEECQRAAMKSSS
jgi:nicotinamidase/pyrazinamidase